MNEIIRIKKSLGAKEEKCCMVDTYFIGKNRTGNYTDKDWKVLKQQFDDDFELQKEIENSFQGLIKDLFDKRGITNGATFQKMTGIDARYYGEFTRRQSYVPSKAKLVKVCTVLDIDYDKVCKLMEALGSDFRKDKKVDYAYYYILLNFRGENIENCNVILKELGLEDRDLL